MAAPWFTFKMTSSPLFKMITDAVSLEEVQELVRRGEVDVKETDCDGNNILHKVCSLDAEKSEVVQYLVSVGAAVNQINRGVLTPLIICAGKGYLSTLKVLLNNGACVDPHGAVKQGHDSAILAAVQSSHEECVRELIKHEADIWYQNRNGENLLMIACMKGLTDIVTYCVHHDVVIESSHDKYELFPSRQSDTCSQLDMHGTSALFHASKSGQIDCLRILLDNNIKYKNVRNRYRDKLSSDSPILTAAVENQEACVMELMSRGYASTDKNSRGQNLLMLAAANGLIKALKECLDRFDKVKSPECDSDGHTAIMHACVNKQYACLKELLARGKFSSEHINRVSKTGFTALMFCAKEGFLEGIKLLINYESNVNRVACAVDIKQENRSNRNGDSALLLAAQSKQEECVRELLNHGADQWFTNRKGRNLLMIACEQGLVETVNHCLSRGTFSQITAMDDEGNNALFLAYKNNQIKCMKVLLGNDKSMNDVLLIRQATRKTHTSLIQEACEEEIERPDIVELFVTHNTLINAVDSDGRTPLMLCAEKGHLETLKVLIKHGASLDLVQSFPKDRPYYSSVDTRNTSLIIAAEQKHWECVLALIEGGADIWYANNKGESILLLAAAAGWTKCVKLCLNMFDSRHESSGCENMNKALMLAIENHHETCALEIISRVASVGFVNSEGQNPLMLAAKSGLINVVKMCLNRGSLTDIRRKDKHGRNALMLALFHGHYDCAREIPKPEDSILMTGHDWTLILQNAVSQNKIDLLQILIHKGFLINRDIDTDDLMRACADRGDVDMLKALVSLGANVSLSDRHTSPLLGAAQRGNENFVLELISLGADITIADRYGQTLLMIAAERGLHRIVKMCLEKETEFYINRLDDTQRNAVMYACEYRQTACLEEILKSGKCDATKAAIQACKSIGFAKGIELLRRYVPTDDDSAEEADITPAVSHSDSNSLSYSTVMTTSKGKHILYPEYSSVYSGHAIIDMFVQGREKGDIWATDTEGQNLLMIAARRGMVDVVKYCLSEATSKNLQATDQEGKTVIMHACSQDTFSGLKNLQCLAEILKSDLVFSKRDTDYENKFNDIDAEIYSSGKSLMQIVCNGSRDMAEAIELLVAKSASVHTVDSNGLTPLITCAREGHLRSICVLVEAKADVNAKVKPTRSSAAKASGYFNVRGTCYRRMDIPLCVRSVTDLFYGDKPEFSSVGDTALLIAAKEGNEQCVKRLIHYGADVWITNNKGENLLMIASAKGLWETVKSCVENGQAEQINLQDCKGNSALLHACKHSQINCIKLLLNNPVCLSQVNVLSNYYKMTPLMMAVHNSRLDIACMLLSKGADPNVVNSNGVTCLLIAAGENILQDDVESFSGGECEEHELVRVLLRYGASVNHVCSVTGDTALTVAIANRADDDVVQELIEEGANINHSDKEGGTALKYAYDEDEESIVRLLLKKGASVTNAVVDPKKRWRRLHDRIYQLLILAGLPSDHVKKSLRAKDGIVPNLYDMCRIPARQYVMNSFPNSNLFFMIPRLILPQKMKDFLLFDMDISINEMDIRGISVCDMPSSRDGERQAYMELTEEADDKEIKSDYSDDFDDYDPTEWDCYEGSDTYSDFYY